MSPAIEKLCSSCKGPSPTRKYCDQCVSDLSITERENPAHGKSARDDDMNNAPWTRELVDALTENLPFDKDVALTFRPADH